MRFIILVASELVRGRSQLTSSFEIDETQEISFTSVCEIETIKWTAVLNQIFLRRTEIPLCHSLHVNYRPLMLRSRPAFQIYRLSLAEIKIEPLEEELCR